MFADLGPEIVNLVRGKDALPRRHGILSMLNRIDETGPLIRLQAPQVKSDVELFCKSSPWQAAQCFA
jgi:hypothetical protein